jgi:hypothetical protein
LSPFIKLEFGTWILEFGSWFTSSLLKPKTSLI